jgi:hypothetical protein
MRTVAIVSAGIVALLLPNVSWGNAAPPPAVFRYLGKPDKDAKPLDAIPAAKVARLLENAPVSMSYRSGLDRPRLVIPRKFAVIDGKIGAKAEADGPAGRTALVGLTLSAAFVTGGFWLVRRSGNAGKVMLVLFVFSAGFFSSGFLGDLSSNEAAPPRLPKKTMDGYDVHGTRVKLGVDVVITTDGEHIELILPKDLLPMIMIPWDEFGIRRPLDLKPGAEKKGSE